ncbi:glycosyltransferase family 2 protein [Chloroflexota bacterium]
MAAIQSVTALIVNYRTLDLTRRCLESLRVHYPTVKVLLIDNGSDDESSEYIAGAAAGHSNISCILNKVNRFHGPALDQGIRHCRTRLVLTLDSDNEIRQGVFLEAMAARFDREAALYAVGKKVLLDPFGYESGRQGRFYFPYIRPCCMLLDREKYLQLRPFIHHGSPGIHNMKQAQRQGYPLGDFPIYEYIYHQGRGTCGRYGYGLGRRHSIENILHQILSRFL